MASFNRVILAGNLTRDPQVKYLSSGIAVCDMGLAINRKFKDGNDQQRDETTFVDVTLFGRTAEVAGEYLAKGRACLIEGRLQFEQWEDKQTQQKRSKLKVIGETLQLLGGKSESNNVRRDDNTAQASAPADNPQWDDSAPNDDVPF